MTHFLFRLFVALGVAMMATAAYSQTDVGEGEKLTRQGDGSGAPCIACHGADGGGNEVGGFPRLAGLNAGYLAKQMFDYNAGLRISAIMQPNVDNLTEQQIQNIAAYYASLPAPPSKTTGTPPGAQVALGEKLTKEGDWDNYIPPCAACHGPGDRGVGSAFPALAGQHPLYIRQQLEAWKTGQRKNDPNQLMAAVAGRMSAEQIAAVAAYLGSLPASAK
ncbi:MAG TPA: c-type cytochrome [Marinobacter sp.]|nr:c-type cytochrome [Marinobacter sp.]